MPEPHHDAKDAVRRQYAAAGGAYVKSTGHATRSDLARMIREAPGAFHATFAPDETAKPSRGGSKPYTS